MSWGIPESPRTKTPLDPKARKYQLLWISDCQRVFKEITRENVTDLSSRWESRKFNTKTILLDEFQGHFWFQGYFKPFWTNSPGPNQPNLLVGDVKQSIYRWRGERLGIIASRKLQDELEWTAIQFRKFRHGIFRRPSKHHQFQQIRFQRLCRRQMEQVFKFAYGVENPQILSQAYSDSFQKISTKKRRRICFQGRSKLRIFDPKDDEEARGIWWDRLIKLLPGWWELQDQAYGVLEDYRISSQAETEGEA